MVFEIREEKMKVLEKLGLVSNIEVEKKQKLEKNWVVGPFSPRWGKIIIVSVTFFLTPPLV